MKRIRFTSFVFVVMGIILLSFTFLKGGSIKGKIIPADAAFQACAVSGKDSFKTNILAGQFEIKKYKARHLQVNDPGNSSV
jgi:hypothetical protein